VGPCEVFAPLCSLLFVVLSNVPQKQFLFFSFERLVSSGKVYWPTRPYSRVTFQVVRFPRFLFFCPGPFFFFDVGALCGSAPTCCDLQNHLTNPLFFFCSVDHKERNYLRNAALHLRKRLRTSFTPLFAMNCTLPVHLVI